MKTKRNTKYSPSLNTPVADTLIVVFSLLIFFLSLFLIYKNLNRTFERKDNTPVAIVVRKHKNVQRKFLDRAVWDRPVQFSFVYNGDTIRTAPDSEASIQFFREFGESVINIGSDTMIQVFKPEGQSEASVQVSGGKVSVQTAGSKVLVKSENTSVTVEKDSVLHADKKSETSFNVAVEKGSAAVTKTAEEDSAEQEDRDEVLTEGKAFSAENTASVIMISPPSYARMLNKNRAGEPLPVVFKWQSSFPETEGLVLETSENRKFTRNLKVYSVEGTNELKLEQLSGTVYWRLYSKARGAEDSSAVSGKLDVVAAPAPVLLEPAEDGKYVYKNDYPPVRFSWKGNDAAAFYLLEVADNPEMRAPKISHTVNTESVTISEFGEGVWYWRVIPHYTGDTEAGKDYAASSFNVRKSEKEIPIELIPSRGIADTAQGKNLRFSWKKISEAKKYRLIISSDEKMENVIVDEVVDANYFELPDSSKTLPNGDYFWAVEGLDKSGVKVASSGSSAFKTLDTGLFLRSVFPPDGYTLAETLCSDTRFTWKTNIESEQRFQVSSSENFDKLAVDVKTLGTGIQGISLKQGSWYWRVVMEVNSEQLKSEPKKLIIPPPLEKPSLLDAEKNVIVILPKGKNKFKWTPVKGADYYQVKIRENVLDSKPFYENLYITQTEVEMFLQSVIDGHYIISIQGFANSTPVSSRRYGLAEDYSFEFKHLKPAELLAPKDGEKIDGFAAALKPGVLKWSALGVPPKSKIILEKSGRKTPILSLNNPDFTVQLPPLEAGKYVWRIIAEADGGFDISSRKDFSFTVLPIPPFPAVRFSSHKNNEVLDVNFFKTRNSITFSWNKIEGATHYFVRIYNGKNNTVFRKEFPAGSDKGDFVMDFKELTLLSRGSFVIEVKAVSRLKDGIIFRDGKISKLRFIIDLPKIQKVKTYETGIMYGQ